MVKVDGAEPSAAGVGEVVNVVLERVLDDISPFEPTGPFEPVQAAMEARAREVGTAARNMIH